MMKYHLYMITLLQKYLKLINDAPLKKVKGLFLFCLLKLFFIPKKPGAFLEG